MSRTDAETEVLAPMQALFLPPRNMDDDAQKAALTGYLDTLQSFERDDLRTAWREVVATHTTRGWPVPGVIVLAARKARRDRVPSTREVKAKEASYTERRLVWDRVRVTGLAEQAVRANVAWAFKCAVLYDGKTAEQISIEALRRSKRSAEETLEKISTGQELSIVDDNTGLVRSIGIMEGIVRQRALSMWNVIAGEEQDTQKEIRWARSVQASLPPPLVEQMA